MKSSLVDGKWVSPPLKFCPVCQNRIHESETECMVCKDLKGAEQRNRERIENKREKCPTCGEILVNGHCMECNVQVTLA